MQYFPLSLNALNCCPSSAFAVDPQTCLLKRGRRGSLETLRVVICHLQLLCCVCVLWVVVYQCSFNFANSVVTLFWLQPTLGLALFTQQNFINQQTNCSTPICPESICVYVSSLLSASRQTKRQLFALHHLSSLTFGLRAVLFANTIYDADFGECCRIA